MTKDKDKTKKILKVLFPGKDIAIGGEEVVTMKPLSLEDLTKVIDAFNRVVILYGEGKDSAAIALEGIKEILALFTYCIDRPMSEIPAEYTPDLIDVFIEQNLSEATLGKWTALIQKFVGELKGIEEAAKKAAESQGLSTKSPQE